MSESRHFIVAVALLALPAAPLAQRGPGRPIGQVTTIGDIIHLELEPGDVVPARPFELDRRTLRPRPRLLQSRKGLVLDGAVTSCASPDPMKYRPSSTEQVNADPNGLSV